jgi:HPt (histidine-containing phosphotransfer) domain-containing protein
MPFRPEHRGASPPDPSARVATLHDLDRATLIARFEGDAELFDEVSVVFIGDSPRLIANLNEARRSADLAALCQAAHAIKGAVSNFTDGPAREAALVAEQLARDGDAAAWPIAAELADLVLALTEALRDVSPPQRSPAS